VGHTWVSTGRKGQEFGCPLYGLYKWISGRDTINLKPTRTFGLSDLLGKRLGASQKHEWRTNPKSNPALLFERDRFA
jgi:hypothetical protein